MTTQPTGSLRRGRARQDAILTAVIDLVAEVGYEQVTVDAIAARAHASKATIYRIWGGKAELVSSALRRVGEGGTAKARDTGSTRGDLLAVMSTMTSAMTGGLSLLAMVEALRSQEHLRELVNGQIENRSKVDGAAIAERALTRGEDADGPAIAAALRLALGHIVLTTLLKGEPPSRSEQVALVDDVLLTLLKHQESSGGL